MDPAQFEQVEYAVDDHVATVRLSRPGRRNSWTGRMAIEYRWALHAAEHDADVGAIVVTGTESKGKGNKRIRLEVRDRNEGDDPR